MALAQERPLMNTLKKEANITVREKNTATPKSGQSNSCTRTSFQVQLIPPKEQLVDRLSDRRESSKRQLQLSFITLPSVGDSERVISRAAPSLDTWGRWKIREAFWWHHHMKRGIGSAEIEGLEKT
jgi:hypothetical protein